MHKVKLFKGVVNELEQLEHDINNWLAANKAKIISMNGNIAPQTPTHDIGLETFPSSDILVIVQYEVSNGQS